MIEPRCPATHPEDAEPRGAAELLRSLADRIDAEDLPQTAEDVADFCDGARWVTGQLRQIADEASAATVDGWTPDWLVEQAREHAPAALSDAERTMLRYALDQAQEKIWSEGGFTDEDQAAVTSLRRLAGNETEEGTH